MSEFTSHYPDLSREIALKDEIYKEGIPVATIPPLMERKDGSSVFDEGEAFSGGEVKGSAEAYITATASPHIAPSLFKETFLGAAQEVLGRMAQLPQGMEAVEFVSPQAIIWWRDTELGGAPVDLLHLSNLPLDKQNDFCEVIERQTRKAVQIVDTTSHQPTIWGSWGYAAPEERAATGRNRGVPTNGHGHLHVIDFSAETLTSTLEKDVSTAEKLNHYKPWASLLHKKFNQPIARALGSQFDADVTPFSETVIRNGMPGIINHGYAITFDNPRPYAEVFKDLIKTAGAFEEFYKNTTENHAAFHIHQTHPDISTLAHTAIVEDACNMGFTYKEAEQFASFTLGIRPTYSQVCSWLDNLKNDQGGTEFAALALKKQLYERIRNRLGEVGTDNSISRALLRGTVAHPNEHKSISGVWSEHAAATFIIEDYHVNEQTILVNRVRIIPGIDSTQSAPEHITGRALRRSTGSS